LKQARQCKRCRQTVGGGLLARDEENMGREPEAFGNLLFNREGHNWLATVAKML
jgi:hypothetical protein